MSKQDIRNEILHKRKLLSESYIRLSSKNICLNIIKFIQEKYEDPLNLSAGLYSPIQNEVLLEHLETYLFNHKSTVSLPYLEKNQDILSFKKYSLHEGLIQGPFQIYQPIKEAEDCKPEIIIVPIVAFDRNGVRLGYGHGYYDAMLANCSESVIKIGAAYSFQEKTHLPVEKHDIKLNYIATEKEFIDINK